MPPYRDPYAEDKDLDEADLGNKFDQDAADESEEEFESSVEDDEDDVSGDDKPAEDAAEEETDDEEELDGDASDNDEEEEDGEEDSDASDEDDEEEEEEENLVPQSRFNEINSNWRRSEERAERLESLLEQAIGRIATNDAVDETADTVEIDVAAVEKEILELAFAGKEDEAVSKRIELDAYKELVWADKYGAGNLDTKVANALDTREQSVKLKEVITSSLAAYPELKEGDAKFDQTIVDEINQTWDGLSAKMPTSVALAKAVKFVTAARGMSSAIEDKADPKSKTKGRKKAAVKKNADAQKRQPPKMRGRSAKDDSLDQVVASKLSDKKLFSMSEKELRTLRGD